MEEWAVWEASFLFNSPPVKSPFLKTIFLFYHHGLFDAYTLIVLSAGVPFLHESSNTTGIPEEVMGPLVLAPKAMTPE